MYRAADLSRISRAPADLKGPVSLERTGFLMVRP